MIIVLLMCSCVTIIGTRPHHLLYTRGGAFAKAAPEEVQHHGNLSNNEVKVPDELQHRGNMTSHATTKLPKRSRIRERLKNWLSILTRDDSQNHRVLTYYGMMLSGAVARSASASVIHPLNVMKTMLQTRDGKLPEFTWSVLSRGAGSQATWISLLFITTSSSNTPLLLTNNAIVLVFITTWSFELCYNGSSESRSRKASNRTGS